MEVDTGVRDGITTAEAQRVKELKSQVKELRRANEILNEQEPKSYNLDSEPERST